MFIIDFPFLLIIIDGYRLETGVYVRARIGDKIAGTWQHEFHIGQIAYPSGKQSYGVNFYGLGMVKVLPNKLLQIMDQAKISDIA